MYASGIFRVKLIGEHFNKLMNMKFVHNNNGVWLTQWIMLIIITLLGICYIHSWTYQFTKKETSTIYSDVPDQKSWEGRGVNSSNKSVSAHKLNVNYMWTSPPLGTQMGEQQMELIRKTLAGDGNLLVWGLGNDSPFWYNSTTGNVIFIEDNKHWFDKITKRYAFLEAYRVHYTTNTVGSYHKYIHSPEIWSDLDIRVQLPSSVTTVHWHVIIVDAPLGCCGMGPGRYQSIYTSWLLAQSGTHIFIDDFERKVERSLSLTLLGKPIDIVTRNTTEHSTANEQAHFIRSSDEDAIFRPMYADAEVQSKVITTWNNTGIDGNSNWTVLLSLNNGFWDFLQNWWWHYKQLNINIPVIIIAEDDIVLKKLTVLNSDNIVIVRSSLIDIPQAVKYNTPLYKRMVSARGEYILNYLKEGINVIYTDVDTVWLHNPVAYLTGKYDIWNQLDSENNLCTGFMAIKSNAKTMAFIKTWTHVLQEHPQTNQLPFNRLIRNSTVIYAALDTHKFPSGLLYFEWFTKEQRLGVIIVHNNYIVGRDRKIERFKSHNLWFDKG